MKKQIIVIVSSLLIAAAVFVPLFLFTNMVIQDHKALSNVVGYLNQSIAEQQKAQQTPSMQPNPSK